MDRQRFPELVEHLRLDCADAAAQRYVVEEEGPAAQIDHDPRQRLVERCVSERETCDAIAVAERLRERLAHDDACGLDQVMRVRVKVACAAELEVETAVARDLLQHVVEEWKPSRHVSAPAPIEVDPGLELRLLALPGHLAFPATQVAPLLRERARSGPPSPRAGHSPRGASRGRRG